MITKQKKLAADRQKTPSGVNLPYKNGRGLLIPGRAITELRKNKIATVASFANFLGLTPFRMQQLSKSDNLSKAVRSPSLTILLRLLLTKMPELLEPEPFPDPLRTFKRLKTFLDIDESTFCLLIGALPKNAHLILSENYREIERVSIRNGSKTVMNPNAQRLILVLDKILDRCETEGTAKYLDLFLDTIEEELYCRGLDSTEYWSGKLLRKTVVDD